MGPRRRTRRAHEGRGKARWWLAVALWPCFSCLIGPPINGPPVTLDTPPSVSDVEPPADEPVQIDRSLTSTRSFQVGRITGLDVDDTIDYEFFVIADEEIRSVQRGTLSVDRTRSTPKLVVYQRIDYVLDACSEDLRNLDRVRVNLQLTDAIPLDQVQTLGATEHVVTVSWLAELTETCPSPTVVAPP
jgi:hypothetical protein